ncbi:hypothetical protein HMPREF1141_1468 [Clostridium sp. MSTE9]|nr:hypothetical protein HMPREF1141_1468 [Clostridium sp. MSTE9]
MQTLPFDGAALFYYNKYSCRQSTENDPFFPAKGGEERKHLLFLRQFQEKKLAGSA